MREIEIKARVDDTQNLLGKLAKAGVKMGRPIKQRDVVFCKPGQQDYEQGSIWLRIRTENDAKTIFTLKADTGRKLDSIEHEAEVSDSKELEAMLRLMGNELYSDLTKTRQKGRFGEIGICLDTVEGLGVYIEAEKLFDDHNTDYQAAADELWGFFAELGLTRADEETLGYDVLVRRGKKYGAAG